MPHSTFRSSALILLAVLVFVVSASRVKAQNAVEAPDRRFMFLEDRAKKSEDRARAQAIRAKQKKIEKDAKLKGFPFDIDAGSINFDRNNNAIQGNGGVIIGFGNSVLEAEQGTVYVDKKQADLSGDVRITDVSGSIAADSIQYQMDTGTGVLNNADIYFEEGYYKLQAVKAKKLEGQTFELENTKLTTCSCADAGSTIPWQLDADRAKITRDGYGQTWGTIVRAYDIPVCYLPYLLFPAKSTRQSGLLAPIMGVSNRNGFEITLPIFWAINSSSDATIAPILQTKSRIGVDTEVRKVWSKRHKLLLGTTILDESERNGQLLGTDVTGLADPTIDTHRFAGIGRYRYRTDKESTIPVQAVVDGRYVSDDLVLREYGSFNSAQEGEIAPYNTRFLNSKAVLRAGVIPSHTLETAAEYTQSMIDTDDTVLQRIPEVTLSGINSFYPFGHNPLGAKFVLSDNLSYTQFTRKELFDGSRAELYERAKIPFHVQNYFDAEVGGDIRASSYQLDSRETTTDGTGTQLPSSSNRTVPGFSSAIGTVLEKVIEVDEGSFIKQIAELGSIGRTGKLVRLKHTLEPVVRYRFVPYADQSDNPQFDSTDRLARRNVVTYSLLQRLYGRYEGRNEYLYGYEEATPNIEDLAALQDSAPLDQTFSFGGTDQFSSYSPINSGRRRELANFRITQSYDIFEAQHDTQREKDTGEEDDPFSDVGLNTQLLPNEYVRFQAGANIAPEGLGLSSYNFGTQLLDKRGDQVRVSFRFVDSDKIVRQVDTGAELRVTDRLKLGYFSRYNDVESEFIENRFGVRLLSSCNCWMLDMNMIDQSNPEQTRFGFTLTLNGLGELGNTLFSSKRNQQQP